jgi:amino acid transporter
MLNRMLRRKRIEAAPHTELNRVLTLLDLTVIGMGATIGTGVYTLLGVIANENAGPAIVISFLISGFASILSALCYSEFAGRVPKAGSAYLYSYVTMGEGVAWFTGWQLLLEYIIGTSSVAKGLTNYIDALADKRLSTWFIDNMGWSLSHEFSKFPDFVSAGFILFVTGLVVMGMKESATMNNCLTSINAVVIIFTVVYGSFFADMSNVTTNFAPYGINGIFQGASISFFCYVGFDVIATTAEEAKNPRRDLPLAIIGSLIACALCYVASSFTISLMQPYDKIDKNAPLAEAFSAHGVTWAKNVISVGAMCGCFSSLLMGVVPMPRITYAIASDGLLPSVFARVHHKFHTPYFAAWATGFLAAILALIFPYVSLANMMSLGTLMAYTAVSMSVLVLRYREYDEVTTEVQAKSTINQRPPSVNDIPSGFLTGVLFPSMDPHSGKITLWGREISACYSACVNIVFFFFGMCTVSLSLMMYSANQDATICFIFLGLGLTVMFYTTTTLILLPNRKPVELNFAVPWVPCLPLLSIACNAHLLIHLPWMTWIRFVVWCTIGVFLYVFYGAENSRADDALLPEHKS